MYYKRSAEEEENNPVSWEPSPFSFNPSSTELLPGSSDAGDCQQNSDGESCGADSETSESSDDSGESWPEFPNYRQPEEPAVIHVDMVSVESSDEQAEPEAVPWTRLTAIPLASTTWGQKLRDDLKKRGGPVDHVKHKAAKPRKGHRRTLKKPAAAAKTKAGKKKSTSKKEKQADAKATVEKTQEPAKEKSTPRSKAQKLCDSKKIIRRRLRTKSKWVKPFRKGSGCTVKGYHRKEPAERIDITATSKGTKKVTSKGTKKVTVKELFKLWHGGCGENEIPDPAGVQIRSWTERKKAMLQIKDNNLKGKNTILSCTVANFNNADQAGKIVTFLKDLYLGGFSKEQITRVKKDVLEAV